MSKPIVTVADRSNGSIVNIEFPTGETMRIIVVNDGIEVTTHFDDGYTAIQPKGMNQVVIRNGKE